MSDLVEFLRARLAEDEETATMARGYVPGPGRPADGKARPRSMTTTMRNLFVHMFTPERVLAEVEAKRETIRLYEEAVAFVEMAKSHGLEATHYQVAAESYMNVIRRDAAVYADHPDYDPVWRP